MVSGTLLTDSDRLEFESLCDRSLATQERERKAPADAIHAARVYYTYPDERGSWTGRWLKPEEVGTWSGHVDGT